MKQPTALYHMLIVMKPSACRARDRGSSKCCQAIGLRPHPMPGATRTPSVLQATQVPLTAGVFENLPGVRRSSGSPSVQADHARPAPGRKNTLCGLATLSIGRQRNWAIIAGPCAIEIARAGHSPWRKRCNRAARVFFARVWKPRTSPYTFQVWATKPGNKWRKFAKRSA